MGNSSSPNPTSDLEGRAIRFEFVIAARVVVVDFNGPLLGGDRGYLDAFDYTGNEECFNEREKATVRRVRASGLESNQRAHCRRALTRR